VLSEPADPGELGGRGDPGGEIRVRPGDVGEVEGGLGGPAEASALPGCRPCCQLSDVGERVGRVLPA